MNIIVNMSVVFFMNAYCTPFVRQYGILLMNGVMHYAKNESTKPAAAR